MDRGERGGGSRPDGAREVEVGAQVSAAQPEEILRRRRQVSRRSQRRRIGRARLRRRELRGAPEAGRRVSRESHVPQLLGTGLSLKERLKKLGFVGDRKIDRSAYRSFDDNYGLSVETGGRMLSWLGVDRIWTGELELQEKRKGKDRIGTWSLGLEFDVNVLYRKWKVNAIEKLKLLSMICVKGSNFFFSFVLSNLW